MMMTPSLFGENLFDEFMDDMFDLPSFDDEEMKKAERKLYGRHASNMMKTDVRDHEDHYELDMELPGFKKEDLTIELTDGYLTISATKKLDKEETEKKTGKFVRRERYSGSMSRAFYVGKDIKQEDIHAKYENGVLKLSVPKTEEKKAVDTANYISIEG